MKTPLHLLAAVAAMTLSAPLSLPASLLPVIENGVTWQYNYDPDVRLDANLYDKRPDDSANTALGAVNRYFGGPGGTGSATVQENYLRTVTTSGGKVEYNTAWGYTPSVSSGITIEARLRVVERTGTLYAGGFLFGAGLSEGTSSGYYVPVPFSQTRIGNVTGLDLTEWTTVRFTIEETGSGTPPQLSIYINNNPVASYVGSITTLSSEASIYNRIRFGDYYTATSVEMDGTVDWDYVRWTSEGAYAPIPEPSVALFPVGALLLGAYAVRSRRR